MRKEGWGKRKNTKGITNAKQFYISCCFPLFSSSLNILHALCVQLVKDDSHYYRLHSLFHSVITKNSNVNKVQQSALFPKRRRLLMLDDDNDNCRKVILNSNDSDDKDELLA